jgi:adenylylsulfate kinase-like enzyme
LVPKEIFKAAMRRSALGETSPEAHFEDSEFVEFFVDPNRLYEKARRGKTPNLTGIGGTYKATESPDICIYSENEPVDQMTNQTLEKMKKILNSRTRENVTNKPYQSTALRLCW